MEANDLYTYGSEIEDKQGTAIAQKKYYDDADKITPKIPKEYKRYQELDNW